MVDQLHIRTRSCSQSIPISCAASKLRIIFSIYIVIYFRTFHVKMVCSRSAPSPPTWWSPRGRRESRLTLLIQTSKKVHAGLLGVCWSCGRWPYIYYISYFNLIGHHFNIFSNNVHFRDDEVKMHADEEQVGVEINDMVGKAEDTVKEFIILRHLNNRCAAVSRLSTSTLSSRPPPSSSSPTRGLSWMRGPSWRFIIRSPSLPLKENCTWG